MNKNSDDRKIAFFDSGVGGLTVLNHAMQLAPNESFLYYADIVNLPYGTKSRDEVLSLVQRAVADILEQDVKALVLACNTATSIAVNKLREQLDIPVIGMEPAIKPAVAHSDPRKVLVLATELTLREDKFIDLVSRLNATDKVEALAAGELVEFAEEFDFDSLRLKKYITQLFRTKDMTQYHSVVLGCTHFSYFKRQMARVLTDKIHLLDGIEGTVSQLFRNIVPAEKNIRGNLSCILSGTKTEENVILPYLNYLKQSDKRIHA